MRLSPNTHYGWEMSRSVTILTLGVLVLGALGACSSDATKESLPRAISADSSLVATVVLGTEPPDSRQLSRGSAVAPPTVPGTIPAVRAGSSTAVPSTALSSNAVPSTAVVTPNSPTSISSGRSAGSVAGLQLVAAARAQVGVTTEYDPAYVGLSFPGGDVDAKTGVCSDVVVRALRGLGIDLQERIHQDMKAHFSQYPKKWGLSSTDTNIDHRRVPNIATYFARRGYERPVTTDPANYQPGDIVWIKLPLDHTGIVSDRTVDGRPLLIHNVGRGAQEEDVLFSWNIVGHYRVVE
jgi:uncharacterized protein